MNPLVITASTFDPDWKLPHPDLGPGPKHTFSDRGRFFGKQFGCGTGKAAHYRRPVNPRARQRRVWELQLGIR